MPEIPGKKIKFTNDLSVSDKDAVSNNINENTELSSSYFILLIASIIICTLGLLLNAAPVVIGGMIIAPLMWPLLKIAVGISREQSSTLKSGIFLLLLSTLIGITASYLLTHLSPIKQLNPEITSRTAPTLLDLIIALAAGAVAAVAIIQPRVSNNIAGVAVSVSLIPPLCVSGIGLALNNLNIFTGGLLLFLSNIESIIFIALIVFYITGIREYSVRSSILEKGFTIIALALVITSVPLFILLKQHSFKSVAYNKVESLLNEILREISPDINIESIKTDVSRHNGKDKIKIDAKALLSTNTNIDYQQQQEIISKLEKQLNADIDLNLTLQRTISVISEQDLATRLYKENLLTVFLKEINSIDPSLAADSITASYDEEKDVWIVSAILLSDEDSLFNFEHKNKIEKILSNSIDNTVDLRIDIVPRLRLQSRPDIEKQQITQDLKHLLEELSNEIDISIISLRISDPKPDDSNVSTPGTVIAKIEIKAPEDFEIKDEEVKKIENTLESKYNKIFAFQITLIRKTTTIY
jgi:uncharacterized hydrophobic protein (TIGR00271 family)